METPYTIKVVAEGSRDILFNSGLGEKGYQDLIPKGAVERTGRNRTSASTHLTLLRQMHWTPAGEVSIPSPMLKGAILGVTKRMPDPSRSYANALDLYRTGIDFVREQNPLLINVAPDTWAPTDEYEYVHAVMANHNPHREEGKRSMMPRTRPAFRTGWRVEFLLEVVEPSLITRVDLKEVLTLAGRTQGMGDWRPSSGGSFGKFTITSFDEYGENI